MNLPLKGVIALVPTSLGVFIGLLQEYGLSVAILGALSVFVVGEVAVCLYWLHKRIDAAEWDHHNLKKYNPSLYKEPLKPGPKGPTRGRG